MLVRFNPLKAYHYVEYLIEILLVPALQDLALLFQPTMTPILNIWDFCEVRTQYTVFLNLDLIINGLENYFKCS